MSDENPCKEININMDHLYWPIIFWTKDQSELIKIEANGDIFIRGKLSTNDTELVNAMREHFGLPEREK